VSHADPLPRTLVRVPSWLGDLVAAEPLLRRLCGEYEARGQAQDISLAGPAPLLALFDGRWPEVQRLAHQGRGGEDARAWRGHARALLLTGSFRSAWVAWRAGIPERIGLARDGRGWLLTRGFAPARAGGRAARELCPGRRRWPIGPAPALPRPVGAAYAELLGLLGLFVDDSAPRLELNLLERRALVARLEAIGIGPQAPFVLACVGGRPGSAKALEPDTAAGLLSALAAEFRWPLLLTAGPGEESQVAAVQAALASRGQRSHLAFTGGVSSLKELIGLSQRARLVVSTDSGPRHVARAAGARCLVLFGPMDPRHSIEHADQERGLQVALPCRPCGQERCPLPEPDHRACLRRQAPQALLQAAQELLGLPGGDSET
jgi:heptosyltransferase II